MQITSLAYLCFITVSLILYYALPKRVQWMVLLAAGMAFFLSYEAPWLIVYPIAASLITYLSGRGMALNSGEDKSGRKKAWMIAGIAGDLAMLIALKYLNFPINTVNGISGLISGKTDVITPIGWLVPLGISFYILSLIDYIRGVYYGTEEVEKNYFKILLFTTFFPCIISGPINRYNVFRPQIEEKHEFDLERIAFGAQRILWGFFKALVISKRLEILVNAIYDDTGTYSGIYVVIAALAFTLQLYTNFSGSIDIIMGTAEAFGIILEENFKEPFFATSIQEFWRRWHITLGAWMRDYVFYPVLRTGFMTRMSDRLKNKLGKKKAKRRVNALAMFILWFTVGLWHGGAWKYIIGSGLLHWIFIMIEEAFPAKTYEGARGVAVTILRRIRTYLLVSASFVFFASADVGRGIKAYKDMFTGVYAGAFAQGRLLELGLDIKDYLILAVSVIMLITVSHLRDKTDVRKKIAGFNIVIRWAIYLALLYYVVLLGNYGPGYSATEFIYQGF